MTSRGASLRQAVLMEAAALESLVRPPFALLLALFMAIGMAQVPPLPGFGTRASMALAVAGWMLASVALNDLADVEIDRVNLAGDPRRRHAAGSIDAAHLKALAGCAAIVAILAAIVLGPAAATIIIVGLALAGAYSLPPIRLGSRGALTSVLLPLGYVAVPFLISASPNLDRLPPRSWLLLGGLYLGFMGRLALKDFRDQRGDTLYGKRTFLLRYGRKTTCVWCAALLVLGGIVSILALPHRTTWTWICVGVQLVASLVFLFELARDDDGHDDRANVLAVAVLGRFLLLVVLFQCWATAFGWARSATTAAVVATTLVAIAMTLWKWQGSRAFSHGTAEQLRTLPPPVVLGVSRPARNRVALPPQCR